MRTSWTLPGFIKMAELGAGAQGEVVLARHQSGTPVAIKYLAPNLLGDTDARSMFRHEAEVLRRVADPHVARLYEYVESPHGAAIVMEAVTGRPLRRVLDESNQPMAPEAALTMLKGSLLGLAAAHTVGIVHRDYKPGNVLVQDDGQSKLIDFGIAVLTGQGTRAGTPAYMAPEQWTGEPASSATDLYAATCVFVECISGDKPFHATTLDEWEAVHRSAHIPVDAVPEPLRPLVHRGMAKRPSDRIWNAYQFVAELEAIATRTYGSDWEQRGLLALGAVAATIASAIPLGITAGALLVPGTSAASGGAAATGTAATGHASATIGQSIAQDAAFQAGSSTSKGVLAKVGGAKGAAGIGAATAGAVAAAWFFWPGPSVGGVSHGALHGYFTRPGVLTGQANMPASETPYMDFTYTVTPARAKPGTLVKLVQQFRARMPWGSAFTAAGTRQCYGENSGQPGVQPEYGFGYERPHIKNKQDDTVAFYRVPPANRKELPTHKNAVAVSAKNKHTGESQPYDKAECAFLSRWIDTYTFRIPGPKTLPPGDYLITSVVPPRIGDTSLRGKPISPESAGATTEGSLPTIKVLDD